jgi:drug/metabolite transporter (DMT)-like permease
MTDHAKGILLLLATVFVFSIGDAVGKLIAEASGGLMASWGRFVFALAALPLLLPHRIGEMARTYQWRLQLVRSTVVIGANVIFYIGLQHIPLADAIAIGFVSPFFTTLLAIPILKENVGVRRWTAIAIGFVGTLIIVRPGLEVRHWAYALPIVSASFWALFVVLTRKLGRDEPPLTTLFYTPLMGAIAMSAATPLYWRSPEAGVWVLLVLMGVVSVAGHVTLIRAYRLAPASLLAPFNYVSIVFATVLGYLLFGTLPDLGTVVGAAVVIASGVYVFHREAVVRATRPG